MPKNDNTMSMRLYKSLKVNVSTEAADKMAETLYLSKSADFKRKFKWVNDVCEHLENTYDADKIKIIRMDCSCAPSKNYMEKVKNMYLDSDSFDEFCDKYNAEYNGEHSISHNSEAIFFSYPTCYCSCIKRADANVPQTWCLCTLGYVKKLFDYVLERDTEVELIESVKTGGSKCVMKIC